VQVATGSREDDDVVEEEEDDDDNEEESKSRHLKSTESTNPVVKSTSERRSDEKSAADNSVHTAGVFRSSAGISFTHGPILGFFAPQGRHVAPIKVKFGIGPLLPAKFDLDRFIGWVYGPQNW